MKGIRFFGIIAGDSLNIRNIRAVIMLFGIVLLCIIWIGLYFKIYSERQADINMAIKETANFARAFEEHTLSTIKSADQAALFLKYQYEKEGRSINIPQYISEGRFERQPFILLSVIDENGDLVVSSQVPFVSSNLKDREHFFIHKNVDSRQLFISKPVLGRSSGKWSIQMTRRVNKPDGSFGGVVNIAVDPFYFTQFYKQIDLGENSSTALVGQDGVIRARQSNYSEEIGRNVSDTILMKKLAESNEGYYTSKSAIDGIKRIYNYRVLSDYPLAVLVGVDEEIILQTFNQRIVSYYLLAIGVTIVIIAFIMMLLGVMTRQKRAEEALREVRDNLEAKVELRTEELIAMNDQLQYSNQELEGLITERQKAEKNLEQNNQQLEKAYDELKEAQSQIIHQEKMACIGQLAAGIAHEINNPLAFIISNLESLRGYTLKNARFAVMQEAAVAALSKAQAEGDNSEESALIVAALKEARRSLKIDYIIGDTEDLIKETLDGASRVKNIVQDLKGFARVESENKLANINEGIESTINIIWNELKYKATLIKDFGDLPLINCNQGQLNQVFMNLIVNAVQAMDTQGEICIKTRSEENNIVVSIADTGSGIPLEIVNRIFEPFFTTKEVGKGTGLGLSVTYDIVKKHGGDIKVESQVGKGTTFTVRIPIVNEHTLRGNHDETL